MTAPSLSGEEARAWTTAGAVALAAHLGAAGLVLAWARPADRPLPEPVMVVELPPQGAAAPSAAVAAAAEAPRPDPATPQAPALPLEAPPVRAPLPADPVTLPPTTPARPVQPAVAAPAAPATPAPTPAPAAAPAVPTGNSTAPGTDPRARRQEADYFALVSAHLNRRKTYPAEARQARQQGIVTVRFTVDRNGGVSGVSIKRSSGHATLDRATLDLLQRVAPLPRMPAAMGRDSVTLSLPIDYSLRTS